jgi:predicted RNA binding protein YcfA (HicA-like mRNA interferase family)
MIVEGNNEVRGIEKRRTCVTDRMPRASGKAVLRALERAGWTRMKSSGGSHVKLEHPNHVGRVVVPVLGNDTLPLGTMKNILDQANLTGDDLKELL